MEAKGGAGRAKAKASVISWTGGGRGEKERKRKRANRVPEKTNSPARAQQLCEKKGSHEWTDDTPLLTRQNCCPALLIRRYKRFLADVKLLDSVSSFPLERQKLLDGQEEGTFTAYVPNTGKLSGLLPTTLNPLLCLLSKSQSKNRKYEYTVEAIRDDTMGRGMHTEPHLSRGTWVGIHSVQANEIANRIFTSMVHEQQTDIGMTCCWSDALKLLIRDVQREVCSPITTKTRFDFKLQGKAIEEDSSLALRDIFVEIKSVTYATRDTSMIRSADEDSLMGRTFGLFPDTVSTRGQKHLLELINIVDNGGQAMLLFIIQRGDVDVFCPFDDADPEYSRLVRVASDRGVRMFAIGVELLPCNIAGDELLFQNSRLVRVML